jgi:hypothetical protein
MSENPATDTVTFEICPLCSQRTASHLFRDWKNVRCCFICAQRSAKDDEDEKALIIDQRYHGMGIRKHIITVAILALLGLFLRFFGLHFLFGSN